ncbi:hypothetical protein PG994_003951 [Apiospora phragmitis]|uniref:Heterokaryon incompatibility domain-containing protein n=1 Tax=Apiospora phragmitis TaxID=2905665 RepID=A0ABR1VZK1_9PEZI
MPVTDNLVAALRRLRPLPSSSSQARARARVLWVDAVCIDQDNTAEKSAQIPLMARLYRSARYVLAWLGEPTEPMEAAILWAQEYIDATTSASTGRRSAAPEHNAEGANAAQELLLLPTAELAQVLKGLGQFKKMAYWKGMWTLQEYYRLPTIDPICMCGPHSFSAPHLPDQADTPVLNAFLAQAKQVPEDWPKLLSLYPEQTSPGRMSLDDVHQCLVGDDPDAHDLLLRHLLHENGDLRQRLLVQKGVDEFVESLKRGEEGLVQVLSEVRTFGSKLGPSMPDPESAPQRADPAMTSVWGYAVKAAAMAPLVFVNPFVSFANLRKPLKGTPFPLLELAHGFPQPPVL